MSTQSMATPRRLSSRTTLQRMSVEDTGSGGAGGQPGTAIIIHTDPSSMSTVDSQGRVGLSSLQAVPRHWATLETAKRCLLMTWRLSGTHVLGRPPDSRPMSSGGPETVWNHSSLGDPQTAGQCRLMALKLPGTPHPWVTSRQAADVFWWPGDWLEPPPPVLG